MNYLMVLPVHVHRLSPDVCATESAFCDHLRMLREELGSDFDKLVVAAPAMRPATYQRLSNYLATISEAEDRIAFEALNPGEVGPFRYWFRHLVPTMLRLNRLVGRASVVHAGPSHVYEPREFIALVLGVLRRRKTICVVDIDERRSAWMSYVTGRWSYRSYCVNRLFYDRLNVLQIRFAARFCSLLLLKGRTLVDDFGRGRPHVKNFLDTAYSEEHIIPPDRLDRKIARLRDRTNPLELVYFGRLTGYKGIDRSIKAVKIAVGHAGCMFRLHIIGTGEEEDALRELVHREGLDEIVQFHGAIPFGPTLFDRLYDCHLLLATPLCEDTPRSAPDAMAAGMPVLAFDTYYYRSLMTSDAVEVSPWPEEQLFAQKLVNLESNRARLAELSRNAVRFAYDNTQEIWLERRMRWTREFCLNDAAAAHARQSDQSRRVDSADEP